MTTLSSSAIESLDATEGPDVLAGTPGDDVIDGLGGDDTIDGLEGDDTLSGGADYDVVAGGAGADLLDGGEGNDTLYSADVSPPYSFPYYGNTYTPPVLDTGSEVDTVNGGAGDDFIFAGYGDNVDGGDGFDQLLISFQGATSGIAFDASLDTQVIGGGTITGIEAVSWVEGSNFDDTVNLNAGYNYASNVAFGMGGNDTLIGGYSTTLLDGGDGDDILDGSNSLYYLQRLDGGAGDDTIIYTSGSPNTVADGGDGNDTIYSANETHGGNGNDTIVLSFSYYGTHATGDAGDDTIQGSAGTEYLEGNDGNDTIDAGEGDDFLTGGTGADVLAGGGGSDRFVYNVGDGDDQITDIAAGDVVEVHGYVAVQSMTQVGGDVVVVFDDGNQITFSNSDTATVEDALYLVDAPPPQGTEGDDTLNGQSGNDIIDGLGGDDTIIGRAGHDILSGGAGSDQIEGGDGSDTLYSAGVSPPYDFPYYGYSYTPPLLDTGSEVDTVNGGAGDDHIFAGYGDNVDGGDGFDQLLISFQGATSGVNFDVGLGTQVIGGGTITGIEGVIWVEGSNYDDTVNLQSGFVAFGMGGNDTLIGGYYTLLLDGGDGNDILDGSGSLYYLQRADGGAGDDIITTTMSPGTVADGGDGNDTIYSASETHGGNGNDTIVLSFSYYGINATGDAGDDVIQGSEGYETLSGGTGNDVLSGGGADDRFIFRPGDGQDVITDFAAGDVVQVEGYESIQSITQVGNDVLLVFSDGDQITFQNSDVATVEAGVQLPPVTDDFIIGGPDNESLNGYGGNDLVAGGAGADVVNGGSGNDDLFSADPDIYWGQPDSGTEHDVLIGGTGDDRLTIGYGDDADGGEGRDTLRLSFGGASDGVTFDTGAFVPGQSLTIAGGTIQNMEVLEYLGGSDFADYLTIAAQDGAITVDGRGGDDFITVMGGTGATIHGGGDNDRVDVCGGNATIFGDDGYDTVVVWGGTATAYGGWGDDYFVSGSGADTFFGDDGDDRISYSLSSTGVTVDLSTGVTPDGDQLYSIESINGSNYADHLTGDWQSNSLSGGKGNDTLDGLDGDDMLNGGAGIDTLRGGFGDDMYIIDNAKDVVIEAENAGTDMVLTYINYTLDKNIERAQAIGSDEIKLVGNALDNSLDGNDASNTLIGGGGNDILDGREGADTMNGGIGNDTYIVDNAGDKIGEGAGEGIDEVVTLVSYTLGSKAQVEIMTAVWEAIDLTGNDFAQTLQGNDFSNVLSGAGGNDTLNGWGGSDTLKGGTGNDVLSGGWGDDRFVFDANPGNDTILDFESGIDKIDLHAFGITMNQVNAVVGVDATVLYVDSNRDGSADFTITLSGVGALDTGDYIF